MRQISSPFFAEKAAIKPRIPLSPPALPTMTLSFTTSGAEVETDSLLFVGEFPAEQQCAGLPVERDQIVVAGRKVDRVAKDRRPTIDTLIFGTGVDVLPDQASRPRIQRVDRIEFVRTLRPYEREVTYAIRERLAHGKPTWAPLTPRSNGDLLQWTVSPTLVGSGICQPVRPRAFHNVLILHLRR